MSKRQKRGVGGGGSGGEQQPSAGKDAPASRELPGPQLGDGCRWDLCRAVAPTPEQAKMELGKLDELSGNYMWALGVLRFARKFIDKRTWGKIQKYSRMVERVELDDVLRDKQDWGRIVGDFKTEVERLETEEPRLRKRCGALLEQALSGSEHGDVVFRFEDGRSPLTGHREVLCAASEAYACMFRSGMVEEEEGIVGVPPGISERGFRGFLEWVYLGRAGEECARADGRELWVLGEMYEVAGLRGWLLEVGIDAGNVLEAYEFGLVPEGMDREGIVARCLAVLEEKGWNIEEARLRGVGRDAAKRLALTRAKQASEDGRRLGWRCVRAGMRILEMWMRANGGGDVSWFSAAVQELKFDGMPLKELRDVVAGCEYADASWAAEIVEKKAMGGGNEFEVEYKVERLYDMGNDIGFVLGVALHGEGSSQRMALVDGKKKRILIVDLESGERVATCGSRGNGFGQFLEPRAIAFSPAGELYVVDCKLDRISVFDRQGRCVRRFGEKGSSNGQFDSPGGISFFSDGDLVVADEGNFRLQIFREDGTFVRAFGSRGNRNGEFVGKFGGPSYLCVGPDDCIAVSDNICTNRDGSVADLDITSRDGSPEIQYFIEQDGSINSSYNQSRDRVQIFNKKGDFVRSFRTIIDELNGSGEVHNIAIGPGGEIIVSQNCGWGVVVYSKEGKPLQIVGNVLGSTARLGAQDSGIDFHVPGTSDDGSIGGAVPDAKGRLFVPVLQFVNDGSPMGLLGDFTLRCVMLLS